MHTNLFSNRNKKYEFQKCILKLTLNQGWVEFTDPEMNIYGMPLNFVKEIEDAVGALQISIVTSEQSRDFSITQILKNNNQEYINNVKEYKLRDWTIYEYQEEKNDQFFQYLLLVKPHLIVYATYNCPSNNINKKELLEAIAIAKTINIYLK